jgi:hypothetical protein
MYFIQLIVGVMMTGLYGDIGDTSTGLLEDGCMDEVAGRGVGIIFGGGVRWV